VGGMLGMEILRVVIEECREGNGRPFLSLHLIVHIVFIVIHLLVS
jgi:hypothetical protein